jgi:hypothetical protein
MVKIIKLKDCYRDKGDDLDIFMVKYSDVNYIEYSDVIVDFLNKYKVCKFLYKNSTDEDTKIYRHLKTIWRNNAIDIILN